MTISPAPFPRNQVLARVRAAIEPPITEAYLASFDHGSATVDLAQRIVTDGGDTRTLTPKEFAIFRLLAMSGGKVLTNNFLVREVWGAEGDVQYLRIYIRQLREKIEEAPHRPTRIVTETGIGYRLTNCELA